MAQPHLERFTPSTKLNPTYVLANVQPPPTGRVWKNLEPSPTRVGGGRHYARPDVAQCCPLSSYKKSKQFVVALLRKCQKPDFFTFNLN